MGVNTCYFLNIFCLKKKKKKRTFFISTHLVKTHSKNKNIRFLSPSCLISNYGRAKKSPLPVASLSPDIFDGLSPPPTSKPEDKWPVLSWTSTPANTIQPAQKVPSVLASWTAQITKKAPINYEKIRGKYEKYFQGNRILPIPELVQEVQPKIVSFVVTDIKTRRLAGIRKETFEDLLKAAGIPAKYYSWRSFATWDVLLPNEDLATKLIGGNITSKYFQQQPEYMGRRKIKITVCNVPIQLNEEVLAAYQAAMETLKRC